MELPDDSVMEQIQTTDEYEKLASVVNWKSFSFSYPTAWWFFRIWLRKCAHFNLLISERTGKQQQNLSFYVNLFMVSSLLRKIIFFVVSLTFPEIASYWIFLPRFLLMIFSAERIYDLIRFITFSPLKQLFVFLTSPRATNVASKGTTNVLKEAFA